MKTLIISPGWVDNHTNKYVTHKLSYSRANPRHFSDDRRKSHVFNGQFIWSPTKHEQRRRRSCNRRKWNSSSSLRQPIVPESSLREGIALAKRYSISQLTISCTTTPTLSVLCTVLPFFRANRFLVLCTWVYDHDNVEFVEPLCSPKLAISHHSPVQLQLLQLI